MKRLILGGLLIFFPISAALPEPPPTTHHLAPSPKTVTWGYFDPSTPPVLRIRSGDTVEVETLPGGGSAALEAAGLSRDQMQPAPVSADKRRPPARIRLERR